MLMERVKHLKDMFFVMIVFCLKWSKMVQMVKNIFILLYWSFGTIWDAFGPHRDIGKPAGKIEKQLFPEIVY